MPKKYREDIVLKPLAESLGWLPVASPHDLKDKYPDNPYRFHRGIKTIWLCGKGWACADLQGDFDSCYENHRYYKLLEEALTTETT